MLSTHKYSTHTSHTHTQTQQSTHTHKKQALEFVDMAHPITIDALSVPFVMDGALSDWPARHWTVDTLAGMLGNKTVTCRLMHRHRQNRGQPAWESEGVYVQCRMDQFNAWCRGNAKEDNPLAAYSPHDFSGYIDYKYMRDMFSECPELLEEVKWSDLGLEGRDGADSTLWVGSTAASTPCHYDTYGFNLVAQIQGRKRWVLFPPEESGDLYPTRVPYEESSVFSAVDLSAPDLKRFPRFRSATPVVLTLEAGQVLYVPRHWWHYVVCLDTAVSINTWVDVGKDNESRLEEAVTRTLASSLIPYLTQIAGPGVQELWINPTEELMAPEINVQYLKMALSSLKSSGMENHSDHQQDETSGDTSPVQQSQCDDDAESRTSTDTVKSGHVSDISQTQEQISHSNVCVDRDQQIFLSHNGTDNTLDIPVPQHSTTRKDLTKTTQLLDNQKQYSHKSSRPVSHDTDSGNASQTLKHLEVCNTNSNQTCVCEKGECRADGKLMQLARRLQGITVYMVDSPFSLSEFLTNNIPSPLTTPSSLVFPSLAEKCAVSHQRKYEHSATEDDMCEAASHKRKHNQSDLGDSVCDPTSHKRKHEQSESGEDIEESASKLSSMNKTIHNDNRNTDAHSDLSWEGKTDLQSKIHGNTVSDVCLLHEQNQTVENSTETDFCTSSKWNKKFTKGVLSDESICDPDFNVEQTQTCVRKEHDRDTISQIEKKSEKDTISQLEKKSERDCELSGACAQPTSSYTHISIYRPTPCSLDQYLCLLSPLADVELRETGLLQGEGEQETTKDCASLEKENANGAETDSQTFCPSPEKQHAKDGTKAGSETSCRSLDIEEALLKSVLHPDVIRLVVSKLKEQV